MRISFRVALAALATAALPAALALAAGEPPPEVQTGPATEISGDGATLTGTVDPNGLQTAWHFEYGRTEQRGHVTPDAVATGSDPVAVSARIAGLKPGRTYHVRLVAASSAGTAAGADVTFTAAGTPPDLGPCRDARAARLRCPNLRMSPPSGMYADRSHWPGHVLLRATSSLNSVGDGPVELRGTRHGRSMRVTQRIKRRGGGWKRVPSKGEIEFYPVPGQGHYWKFEDAARFELWAVDGKGRRTHVVRVGPKHDYCLRDLRRTRPSKRSPRHAVYPACRQSAGLRAVTLGTSVGWSDIYPASYNEQWINVTGLRGCFVYRMIADPKNRIVESAEHDNAASRMIRLPWGKPASACRRLRG